MHLNVLEPELAILCLSLLTLRPLWVNLRERFRPASVQSSVDEKSTNLTPVSREDGESRTPVSWRDVIEGDSSKYDVYIHAKRTKSITSTSSQPPYRPRVRPCYAASPHRQPKPPQPPQPSYITIDKSWSVSYHTASLTH
ncbi:hypothetical protein F4805DRAFT_290845 [Annulohypoxylon moriforme]|nr:hypothetical protein F4805DRAFT_290845 [Annulohypoxylon moriforme]